MESSAMDNAEVTLFYDTVKFRDAGGAERTCMRLRRYAKIRFDEKGQEPDYIAPVSLQFDGVGSEEITGFAPSSLKIFLEPAPVKDDIKFPHDFGQL